jgi:hypothetical protein
MAGYHHSCDWSTRTAPLMSTTQTRGERPLSGCANAFDALGCPVIAAGPITRPRGATDAAIVRIVIWRYPFHQRTDLSSTLFRWKSRRPRYLETLLFEVKPGRSVDAGLGDGSVVGRGASRGIVSGYAGDEGRSNEGVEIRMMLLLQCG